MCEIVMNLRSNAGMDLYCFENANSLDLTYGKCVIKHCELKLCLVLGRLNLFLNYINMPKSGSATVRLFRFYPVGRYSTEIQKPNE